MIINGFRSARLSATLLLILCAPAVADHRPQIVVPGRYDTPVLIDGENATYAIVAGEWGLFRPGSPVAIDRQRLIATPGLFGSYFPSAGRTPRSGRLEIAPDPNRPLPVQAESFHRSWSTSSDRSPATLGPDIQNGPPVHLELRPGQQRFPDRRGPPR